MFTENTYSGLIILIELADVYQKQGCLLEDISKKNRVPLSNLQQAADRLEIAGLVERNSNSKQWYYLLHEPKEIVVRDVVALFETRFAGHFTDKKNGTYLPDSHLRRFLRMEHESFVRTLKKRLGYITLDRYVTNSKIQHM